MIPDSNQQSAIKEKKSLFEWFTEIFGWIQIFASPFLGGIFLGFLIYIFMPTKTGLIVGISVCIIGLITGILWATKVWRKKGTQNFMSRTMATPELDKADE